MKAVIKDVKYLQPYESKYGTLHNFSIKYGDKSALYSAKNKDQSYFVKGKEAEFTEEERKNKAGKKYFVIKRIQTQAFNSNFGKALQREQGRYTSMGASYCKDLILSGHLKIEQWQPATEKLVRWMYKLDKEMENG